MKPKLSNQWITTYYKATSEAWKSKEFREQLLSDPKTTLLKNFGFQTPENITILFIEVNDNDFSQFPEFSVSVFDEPQQEKITLKVPLIPAPSEFKNELSHLNSFIPNETVMCCCACI